MDEQKKELRSVSEIEGEYQRLCARAGHLQYTIDVMKRDLDQLNKVLRDLNTEHSKAKQQAADAPKQEEAKNESA